MITYENIIDANAILPRIDIKGKRYTVVSSRIQAFRKLIPDGSISTEILSMDEETVVMRATIADETGRILATGTAFENKGASRINATSYIENCETSAVGRALGMLGIGSDESLCSAEELVNAIKNQGGTDDPKVRAEILRIVGEYPERELSRKICERYKVGQISELSAEDAKRCLRDLKKTVKEFEAA